MTSTSQERSRRPAGRGMLLLVLAVLTGVFAMHGLAPGGPPAAHADSHARHAAGTAEGAAAHQAGQDCVHAPGGGTAGHLSHADATCAAGGIGTPYAPPAPAPALDTAAATWLAPPGRAVAATQGGRAPPDLAQLQLLRI
ncbi:DUF6153 family protein [Streptomyces sp. 8N706]|uniref:DUF6153 family protein n=1 Tax=Streptomyces sp. 8N706 TaxID=3457416 RepID=UPI003FCF6D4A